MPESFKPIKSSVIKYLFKQEQSFGNLTAKLKSCGFGRSEKNLKAKN